MCELDFLPLDPNARTFVEDLGAGIVARYTVTIAHTVRACTLDCYKHGADRHVDLHCARCCCNATEEWACRHPAAGFFTVGQVGDQLVGPERELRKSFRPWMAAAQALAAAHLLDPVRHHRLRRPLRPTYEDPHREDQFPG